MDRWSPLLLLVLLAPLYASHATEADGIKEWRQEEIQFLSRSPYLLSEVVTTPVEEPSTVITAELTWPLEEDLISPRTGASEDADGETRPGEWSFPCVILLPPAVGWETTKSHIVYQRHLLNAGFCTLQVFSLEARGWAVDVTLQTMDTVVSPYALMSDAFFAAKRLKEVLGSRLRGVGVMGWDVGGEAALYSSYEPIASSLSEEVSHDFNAELNAVSKSEDHGDDFRFDFHIPFYPFCGYELDQDTGWSGGAIFLFIGLEDKFAPSFPCAMQIHRIRAGCDVFSTEIFEYDGPHYFDAEWERREVSTFSRLGCEWFVDPDFQILLEENSEVVINSSEGKEMALKKCTVLEECSVGRDNAAAEKALDDFRGVVRKLTSIWKRGSERSPFHLDVYEDGSEAQSKRGSGDVVAGHDGAPLHGWVSASRDEL